MIFLESLFDEFCEYKKYLIVLGYATTKEGKRAILRGFIFDSKGEITARKERIILQAKA